MTDKEQNLAQLVAEYEAESNAKRAPIDKNRKEILAALDYEGHVKSYDYDMDQMDMWHWVNIDMLKHYDDMFAQMVRNYQIVDIIKKADKRYNEPLRVMRSAKYGCDYINPKNATPQQLREYVIRFNSQHKH